MFLEIALAIILARILGEGFDRIKQPAVVGEIIAGIILGGFILGRIIEKFTTKDWLNFETETFDSFSQFGIVFLMFLTGLDTNFEQLNKTKRIAFYSTVGGVTLPLILGFLIGKMFGYSNHISLIIGLLLTATSIGVTARTLIDIDKIHTDVGVISLSIAVMDDMIGLILLVAILGTESIFVLGAKLIIFFIVTLFIGLKIIGRIMKASDQFHTSKGLLSISLGICFIFAAFAQEIKLAAIVGAFFTGLIMSTTIQSKRIISDVKVIGYSLFIPLFFVSIGTRINLEAFRSTHVLYLSIVILIVAIVGKLVGIMVGAIMSGFPKRGSFQLGICSIPRMEVALIIIVTAIHLGVFKDMETADNLLAATIFFTLVTTLITPPLLKWSFKEKKRK